MQKTPSENIDQVLSYRALKWVYFENIESEPQMEHLFQHFEILL